MKTANIFNIQHFSVHDGPGVRTVVFFKGCNLRCKWCHNPESIYREKEILLYPDRCIGCGACLAICPTGAHRFEDGKHLIDKEKCIHCFKCCEECYADALVSVGEEKDIDYILRQIKSNIGYFEQSGGGATFSGGECMLQQESLVELLKGCKEMGIHTAVDTAGNVPWDYFENVIPYTDLFLYDIKAYDPQVHKACTGVENGRILDNFRKLMQAGCEVLVRIPYIPGCNDGELEGISQFLADFPQVKAELLPYHSMGNSKYHALLREEPFSAQAPDKALVAELKQKYKFI